MRKTLVILVILIIIVLGTLAIFGGDKNPETPKVKNSDSTNNNESNNTNTESMDNMDMETTNVNIPTPVIQGYQPPADQSEIIGDMKEFVVNGQNFSFSPSTLIVKKGDKVKITFNVVSGFHDFVIDEFGVASKKKQGPATEVLEFTANKVGNFEYYCSVGTHRAMGMKGTLIVKE